MSFQQDFEIELKNLLGEQVPTSVPMELNAILDDSYFEKIKCCPVYQRPIRWTPAEMNKFISNTMDNGAAHQIVMYKLDKTEKCDKYEYEVIDGQHRLFTLKAFMDSTERRTGKTNKPFIVHWVYKNASSEPRHIFYKRTPDVENWCNKNGKRAYYLTEGNDKAKLYFDKYLLNVTIVRQQISIDSRRIAFLNIQNGTPVRNSDLSKNKVGCKFVKFIGECDYEQTMCDDFFTHCTKQALNYWLPWVSRCFFLYKRYFGLFEKEELNYLNESEIFLYRDADIQNLVDENSIEFNPKSDQVIDNFNKVFRTYINFLLKMKDKQLNPTQMFALFYICCDSSAKLDIILTHIPYISIEGKRPENKQMWECKATMEDRRKYFNKCLEDFRKIKVEAPLLDNTKITKRMREKVWEKCRDNKCDICESNVIKFEDFEAGHIVARNMGGATKLNNLLPMCSHCNRTMSTRNACEYKKDVYPDLYDNWIKTLKPIRLARKKTIKITPVKTNIHIFFE